MNTDLRYHGNPMDWEGVKGDLISRSVLEKSMRRSINERYISWTKTITVADIATLIFDEIDNAPTVEYTLEEAFQKTVCEQRLYCPQRPQGEWIIIKSPLSNETIVKCDKCGDEFIGNDVEGYNFCPNCGADMRKGGAE